MSASASDESGEAGQGLKHETKRLPESVKKNRKAKLAIPNITPTRSNPPAEWEQRMSMKREEWRGNYRLARQLSGFQKRFSSCEASSYRRKAFARGPSPCVDGNALAVVMLAADGDVVQRLVVRQAQQGPTGAASSKG